MTAGVRGLLRRATPPERVRALRLPRGEHREAWALTSDGGAVVLTDAGVRLVGPDGSGGELVPWVEVDRATWDPPRLVLEPSPRDGLPLPAQVVELADPRDVPRQLRARVDATIVWSGRRPLATVRGAHVRLVARRAVGGDDLRWRVWPDEGVPLHDPLVREEIERLLQVAQETVGPGVSPHRPLGLGLGDET